MIERLFELALSVIYALISIVADVFMQVILWIFGTRRRQPANRDGSRQSRERSQRG